MGLYYLRNKDAQAHVSKKGGQVINWVQDGKQIIYLQQTVGSKLRGGIPICFPFFGPPKPRFSEIRQHGWLRDENLVMENGCHNGLKFKGISQNRKGYPWSLEYKVSISLKQVRVLELKLEMKRLKDGIEEDAPINPAYHPYFSNLGLKAVKIGEHEREISLGQDETVYLKGNKVLIIDLGEEKVQMTLGGDFDEESCITLWTDNKKYFCVEPSLTHPNDFNTPKGKYLKQGEVLTLICRLRVLP